MSPRKTSTRVLIVMLQICYKVKWLVCRLLLALVMWLVALRFVCVVLLPCKTIKVLWSLSMVFPVVICLRFLLQISSLFPYWRMPPPPLSMVLVPQVVLSWLRPREVRELRLRLIMMVMWQWIRLLTNRICWMLPNGVMWTNNWVVTSRNMTNITLILIGSVLYYVRVFLRIMPCHCLEVLPKVTIVRLILT